MKALLVAAGRARDTSARPPRLQVLWRRPPPPFRLNEQMRSVEAGGRGRGPSCTSLHPTAIKPASSHLALLLQMLHSFQMLFGKASSRLRLPPLLLCRCCLAHPFLQTLFSLHLLFFSSPPPPPSPRLVSPAGLMKQKYFSFGVASP